MLPGTATSAAAAEYLRLKTTFERLRAQTREAIATAQDLRADTNFRMWQLAERQATLDYVRSVNQRGGHFLLHVSTDYNPS